jgi:putative tricarboxylic transport membrane protein
MKKFDLQSSLFLLLISITTCVASLQLSLGSLKTPGAGFMPFVAGAFLGVFALSILVEALLKTISVPKTFWENAAGKLRVFLTLASLLLYVIGLNFLGFIIMTGLFVGFLLAVIGNERWTTVIAGGILSALGSFALFELWLKLQLPKGFLGI